MKEVDLDAALRQRKWSARRVLMVALVVVLVLLTISCVIVTVNPRVPVALGEILHGTPTPTATIGPGGNFAYYENGAPWGKLALDGRSIPIDVTPTLHLLDRGRHTLTYLADPFPPLHCAISTPAAASDTCPLDTTFANRFGRPTYGARVVDLGSTIERLPAAQREALIALVRSQVAYTSPVTTVRPGEHYLGNNGGSTTREMATQPLTATIQIRLQDANTHTNSGPGFPTLPECVVVCLPPLNNSMRPDPTAFPNLLEVWAHIKMGYHYTTQDGSVVLDYAPLRQTQQTTWQSDSLVAVYVEWNGQWQITLPPQDNTTLQCQYGRGDLFPSAGVYPYTLTGTRPAPNPTDCCLFVVRQISGNTVFGPPILFLDRFGVLLAVGDDAHQLLPDLPVASQRETDEANAIAAQGPLP